MITADQHQNFMAIALRLARRGVGRTAPNPPVGCVLTRDIDGAPRIVGRGWCQPGGRPHAEPEALRRAGSWAAGATAYVTLEPCSHHGKTPPCAQALIDARIARVFAAVEDPNPKVAGQGIQMLRAQGIDTHVGLCADEARAVMAGYLSRREKGRPFVTLKLATSLDGRIAVHSGKSKWITSEAARHMAHLLRAQSDAILVGSTTAIQDDPELTCRIEGLEDRSPMRVVTDSHLRLPLTSKLVQTAEKWPLLIATRDNIDKKRESAFKKCGVDIFKLPTPEGAALDIFALLSELASRGVNDLLVEGGGRIAASLLQAGLVDRIQWFRAPKILGGDGVPAVASMGILSPDRAPNFVRKSICEVGEDIVETYLLKA